MPPQLFRVGRMRRTASSNSDENEDAFKDYKVIMEEIKREQPDLLPSAVQQMAVERFSSIKEKRCSQSNRINDMIAGIGNFRFGMGKDKTADTNDPEDRRRSFNPRVSVPQIDTRALMSQSFVSGISIDDEDSLEDSLQNIEASVAPPRRQASRRGRRSSLKRASLTRSSAELVDVQEDKELHVSVPDNLAQSHQDLNVTTKKNGPGLQNSMSDELPDEIKAVLGEFDNDDGQGSFGSNGRREDRRRNMVHESIKSSMGSSLASIDSINFEGDFSAWGNNSSLS
jgi:hypothetical protein